jgi:hypothetical protein
MGFCDSSDFSSLGVSADGFAEIFVCLPLRLLSRLIRCVWMMRGFFFGMSMVMSVLQLLWASRRMLLVLKLLEQERFSVDPIILQFPKKCGFSS